MTCVEFWKTGERSEHLDECPRCRQSWEAQQRVADALRSAAAELSSEQAPPRVESRLLAAMRAQAGLGVRHRRSLWVDVLAWGSAAAAVAVLAAFLVKDRAPAPVRPQRPNASEMAALEGQAYTEVAAMADAEFVPLPNAAALESDEEATLVRVELPRSAILAMGFNVSGDDEEPAVAADVVLGPDGLARAVRILDEPSNQ